MSSNNLKMSAIVLMSTLIMACGEQKEVEEVQTEEVAVEANVEASTPALPQPEQAVTPVKEVAKEAAEEIVKDAEKATTETEATVEEAVTAAEETKEELEAEVPSISVEVK